MTKHFLGIGVNYHFEKPDNKLDGCEEDIKRWKEVLVSKCELNHTNCTTIFTLEASIERVEIEFRDFLNRLGDNDLGIFVYSGHGINGPGRPDEETDQAFTCNNGFFRDDIIRQHLNILNNKKTRLILIFDCCFSNTITDSILKFEPFVKTPIKPNPRSKSLELSKDEMEWIFPPNKTSNNKKSRAHKKLKMALNDHYFEQYEVNFLELDPNEKEMSNREILISACGNNKNAVEDFIDGLGWRGILSHYSLNIIENKPKINYKEFMLLLDQSINSVPDKKYIQRTRITGTDEFKNQIIFE